jgi:hypothetical protein
MRRYQGTETVKPGFYFNLRQLSFDAVDKARPLTGDAGDVYRRVPVVVLFLVAPFLGLAFVLFLPFIGIAVVAWMLGVKAVQLVAYATRATARVLRPGWEPALAFLSRSKRADTKPQKPDAWADEAQKKLDRSNDDAS